MQMNHPSMNKMSIPSRQPKPHTSVTMPRVSPVAILRRTNGLKAHAKVVKFGLAGTLLAE
jgi:hypothetical protein